jgi:hypothetical protein
MAGTRNHFRYCIALWASCVLSLAACSSGGGGGAATTATFTPAPAPAAPATSGIAVNLQAAKSTVTYQAAAATALGASKGMGNIIMSAAGQGAIITLTTDASGNLSGVGIPAGGITASVSSASGNQRSLTSPFTLDFGFQLDDTFTFTNTYSYTLSQVAAGQGLTSSAYGLWASTGNAPPSDAGTFAFGNLTPATSVPATGSATFNGFTMAMGGAADGSATFSLKGNAQIVANFATQTVITNLTNFSYASSAKGPLPDLTGTSAITGNAYAGAISGSGLAGTINGNFYGSAAQETTGVWQASGGGNAWIGSYGAK